jgi:hypothetical protein
MKRLLAFAPLLVVLAALTVGCKPKETSKVEETTTVTTPEGSTTETTEIKVEEKGENPPPVNP